MIIDKFHYIDDTEIPALIAGMEAVVKCAAYFKQPIFILLSHNPNRKVVHARHVTFYVLRTHAKLKLKQIGGIFGVHHSTVTNGVDVVESQLSLKHENTYKTDVQNLETLL